LALLSLTSAALFAIAYGWNPWRLVILQEHRAVLAFGLCVSVIAALVLTMRRVQSGWLRGILGTLAILAGICSVLPTLVLILGEALTPFQSVAAEEKVVIASEASVHRVTWNSTPFHTCVEL
jgi:hypothetical protein